MYLKPTKNHYACDIEGDGLREDVKNVWCVCLENVTSHETLSFVDAEKFRLWLEEHPEVILVGHNFLAYDAPVLNRLWGTKITVSRVVDTIVLSQLYDPSLKGGHSLFAWGNRVSLEKIDFNEYDKFSDEMLTYCARDTAITARVFLRLTQRMRSASFSEFGCELEHKAWNIIQNKQRQHGFPFNIKEATGLYASLRNLEENLREEIYKLWPAKLECVSEFSKAYKANGEPTQHYQRHVEQYPRITVHDDGSYSAFDWVSFNLGSPKQRVEKLLKLGWTPTAFTKSGNPKVDEDTILQWAEESGRPEGKALATWLVANSRANMINTWINAYNEKTGAIHGQLWVAGTLRYRHSGPNSANIPAVRKDKDKNILYGQSGAWSYESRDLWTCGDPEEFDLVGIDAKGIQLRVLAEHVTRLVGDNARPFTDAVLDGDPHTNNATILGFNEGRDPKAAAKKFYYTLIMGGGGKRLAEDQLQFGTVLTPKEGADLKAKLIESIPGFADLIKKLQTELKATGRITLSDGSPILVPSDHMVIPYLLQGDESRIMKLAMIYTDEVIRRGKFDGVWKVADIHDEWQFVCKKEQTDDFISKALPSFPRAGIRLGYTVPIEGSAEKGKTWAETH